MTTRRSAAARFACAAGAAFVVAAPLMACFVSGLQFGNDSSDQPSLAGPGESCMGSKSCGKGVCDDFCNTGPCPGDAGWCTGGSCSCGQSECAMAPSSDCASGWVCNYVPPDSISAFFGSTGENLCQPTCGHCPPNQHCDPSLPPGSAICTEGTIPPTVAIDDGVDGGYLVAPLGQSVHFQGMASSTAGSITSWAWTFQDTGSQPVSGPAVDHVFSNAGDQEVSLTVIDSMNGTANVTATVSVCTPPGSSCSSYDAYCCSGLACDEGPDGGTCR